MTNRASRREFLRTASALSVAGAATPWALNLAAISAACAQTAINDYKALVCIFMYGGNDHSNTIVPVDNAGYQQYATSRTNLALAQNSLLPLAAATNASLVGRQVGMRAEMVPLKALYDQQHLAVLANVGTLRVPTTLDQYRARSVPLPPQLFSHNDQQVNWQTDPDKREGARVGWGGKLGDALATANQYQNFTCISASGTAVYLSGRSTVQMQINNGGAIRINAIAGQNLFQSALAPAALNAILTGATADTLGKDYVAINKRSIDSAAALNTALGGVTLATVFPNTGLGNQLRAVARVIGARTALGAKRQVFHASIGGFDQHSGLIANHGTQWLQVANAMSAFYQAMVELNLANNVTAFTASDFGRTLDSNGDGSDHGWGAHHLVMGGAVKGGDVYGKFPTVVLRGAEDVGRGNLLPSTSVDEYAATLSKWFGISPAAMRDVIPGVGNWANGGDLGFMSIV